MALINIELIEKNAIRWLSFKETKLSLTSALHIFKVHIDLYDQLKGEIIYTLSKEELKRKDSFYQDLDSIRFSLAKYVLRKILSIQLNILPNHLNFLRTIYNKPYLNNSHFNISHSGDYVVIALSEYPVGIDVEQIKTEWAYDAVAKVCFTENERVHLHNHVDFYTYWTRKEAILKASGEGLIDNLHEIECIKSEVKRLDQTYKLITFAIDETHLSSIAYDKNCNLIYFWEYKI